METRHPQLAYSDQQAVMLDEASRQAKAAKIAAVIQHFLGRDSLTGLSVLDVGCSGGIIANQLRRCGAFVTGVDIDVPGLGRAQRRYGGQVSFVCGDSQRLPFAAASVDVIICNHIYEHVVRPQALFDELRRVVRQEGLLYLGLGNRLGVIEPHYRLPFLSWLPRPLAHRYVRAFKRASHYHEAFSTWTGLRRLANGLHVWDYTFAVLTDPVTFAAGDVVPSWATRLPHGALRALRPIVPTYIWVATPKPSQPLGTQSPGTAPPTLVATP
jgi:2-polyprenyl-3-methyl-5-hydroxy-6-metoxy-1,4-benzoquinol methylase